MKKSFPNPVYLGLVHGPVQNKRGEEVTTSVTNLDIHDISRSSKTFGLSRYFIITPVKAQHQLLERILGHWESEVATQYNPDRQEALGLVGLVDTVDQAKEFIKSETKLPPLVVVTGAKIENFQGDSPELWDLAQKTGRPLLILFGTGWGLAKSIVESADFRLRPIYGRSPDGYNHLSVRSAVAIYLDRLARPFN